jgi:uncharacterized membrane protein
MEISCLKKGEKKMENKNTENNKWIAVLSYFIFFLPLIMDKDSEFGKYHANQGLNLLILTIAVSILGSIIPFIGLFLILPVGGIFCFVLAIMGILNAYKGLMKELPLIGKFRIIK